MKPDHVGRRRLPDRRPSETRTILWRGTALTVTAGFCPDTGALREVFADGPRHGSDLHAVLADACVVISLALQHGARPSGLGRSLGTVPVPGPGVMEEAPASVLGAIVAVLTEIDPA